MAAGHVSQNDLYVLISDPRIWEFKRLCQREVVLIIFQEPALVLPDADRKFLHIRKISIISLSHKRQLQ